MTINYNEIERFNKLKQTFFNSPERNKHYSKLINLFHQKNGNNYYSAKDLKIISSPQLDFVHCAIIFKDYYVLYAFDYGSGKFIQDGKPLDDNWYEHVTNQLAQANKRVI